MLTRSMKLRMSATRQEARIFWQPLPNHFAKLLGALAAPLPVRIPTARELALPRLASRRYK